MATQAHSTTNTAITRLSLGASTVAGIVASFGPLTRLSVSGMVRSHDAHPHTKKTHATVYG